MKTDKTGGRRNLVFNLSIPPDELQRARDFGDNVGRPLSWILRDALRLYLDRMEIDAEALAARLKPSSLPAHSVPPPDVPKMGRPHGSKTRRTSD